MNNAKAFLRLAASVLLAATYASHAQDRQTPIDINTATVTLGQAVTRGTATYTKADLSVVNTYNPAGTLKKEWTTVRANIPANAGVLTLDGTTWDLLQFHFHTPSEHSFGSLRAPMEVHFVHKDRAKNVGDPDSLLVVGAWIVRGAANPELEKIFSNLPAPGATVNVSGFDLSKVLPASFGGAQYKSFAYPGSLTAPTALPNSTVQQQLDSDIMPEIVKWVVLSEVVEMSDAQIQKFRALYSEAEGNSRPRQPIAGRRIDTDLTAAQFSSLDSSFRFQVLPRTEIARAQRLDQQNLTTGLLRLDHQNLTTGLSYKLEISHGLDVWVSFGNPFTAESPSATQYIDATDAVSFFRLGSGPENP